MKSTMPAGKVPALPAIPFGRISILCGLALLAIAGCSKSNEKTAAAIAPPKPDPWILSCNDPNAEEPALLWNGLLGVRIGRDATFVGNRFEIDSYEKTGEEKIMPLPSPGQILWFSGKQPLDPQANGTYLQALDMRTGILKTSWKNSGISIAAASSIHPGKRSVATSWTLASDYDQTIRFVIRSLPCPASMTLNGKSIPVNPNAISRTFVNLEYCKKVQDSEIVDWLKQKHVLADNRAANGLYRDVVWEVGLRKGQPFTLVDQCNIDPNAISSGAEVEKASRSSIAEDWKTDIEIDGPVEDQQAIRSFLFYLRSAIHPKGKMSVSPFGLSDATYNGHVFWDADTWVFPALALINPDRAKAIANYRLAKFGKNQPDILGGKVIDNFPWESSVSGKEVAPGEMHKEIHINGDVAWMLDNAAALGLIKPQNAQKVIKSVASFYLALATKRPDGKYDLKDVISPDEFHTGDNDLYTNLLANWSQKRTGSKAQFYLPRDKETYLTYDNDGLKGYKQAAAVLGIYPLQMINDAEARKMMDRYADKVTKNGPAMSHSVHALIWARLGETEKAYNEWKKSWQLYTNHPLMLFSEKPKKKTTYFTTGAAGCLQTVLYGFLGFRIDYEKDKMAAWSTPLNNGKWISIRPRLPAKWKSVKFTNFTVKGKRYNLTIDASGVKVTQGEP